MEFPTPHKEPIGFIITMPSMARNVVIEHDAEISETTVVSDATSSPVSDTVVTHFSQSEWSEPDVQQIPALEIFCGKSASIQGYGHHPLHDRSQRPMHVLIAGAGPSGISVAIELMHGRNVTFQIFEKNHDVGGTWYENRYPGAACDVASHAYQWSYEGNPDWSHHFAPAEEIRQYIIDVATKHNIYSHVRLDSKVIGAQWDEVGAKWTLQVLDTTTNSTFEAVGDIFVNAGGILNNWKWPEIDGLDTFRGSLLHTACWDNSIQLEGKRIGVIGSGATSIQLVPAVQPIAQSVEIFIRSPTYVLSTVGFGIESSSYNQAYSEEQKKYFHDHPAAYHAFRKRIEQQMNENFVASVKDSAQQRAGREMAVKQMRDALDGSPELQEKLIPQWELGCRRMTPGLPYLKAVQQPNVHVERTSISKICQNGIETSDGHLHEMDILVCATGFDTSFSGNYDIVGRDKKSLRDRWKETGPEAYLGLAVAGYPNYFTLLGPNCPIANGSLFPCIEATAVYIRKVIEKMQTCQIRSVDVKEKMQKRLNEYYQRLHQDLVWSGSCSSWYKDRQSGKVTAVWPGSSIHYMEVLEEPRWEDYEIEYCVEDDPWAFLGDGRSQREFEKTDLTYYLDRARKRIMTDGSKNFRIL